MTLLPDSVPADVRSTNKFFDNQHQVRSNCNLRVRLWLVHPLGSSPEPCFLCWPRPRPNNTNFPLPVCCVAAFLPCTRAGVPATRARDTVPLRQFQGTDSENGRHRPLCRRDTRTVSPT